MVVDKQAVDQQIDNAFSMALPLTLTIIFGVALTGLLVLSGKIGEATELGFLTDYKTYVILSVVVSLLTDNPAAALTMGSFAGLVVGFGSQTVMHNLIAGGFMAVSRPVRIGDDVVLGPATNSGIVKNITLMHIILETEEKFIKVSSGTTVNQVLQVVKPTNPDPSGEGDSDASTE
jgi:small-conductance mechanosensitive channel